MATSLRQLWIIANWKSNETIAQALEWISFVGPKLEKRANIKVVVCPTFVAIEEVKKACLVGNYSILVGAQDLSPFEVGPYTGEEAASLLKDMVDLVILGHSERRQNFNETDEMVTQKVDMAKKYNIIPLVCVQDENTPVPDGVDLIAYEPIFAIGTGKADTPQNASEIAKVLKNKHNQSLKVLYGGSITADNAKAFLQQELLSGLLIGGASLDPEQFLKIVEISFRI